MDAPTVAPELRVMTYNVHGCVGTDGKRSEARIAEIIAQSGADIVGLQELDLGRRRSAGVDQAGLIAEHLGWHLHFHPAMSHENEHYGDAIVSRFPLIARQARELPAVPSRFCPEKRSAHWVEVQAASGVVHVINTHLGLGRRERLVQAQLLAGPEWIGSVPADQALIVLGDFNSLPGSPPWRAIAARMVEVRTVHRHRRAATYPTAFPFLALDHIFVNDRFAVRDVLVFRGSDARKASDHFPLVSNLHRRQPSKSIRIDGA
jgi:endonuclease/exonuclease/phosphatase family metal-dependent hydrolase